MPDLRPLSIGEIADRAASISVRHFAQLVVASFGSGALWLTFVLLAYVYRGQRVGALVLIISYLFLMMLCRLLPSVCAWRVLTGEPADGLRAYRTVFTRLLGFLVPALFTLAALACVSLGFTVSKPAWPFSQGLAIAIWAAIGAAAAVVCIWSYMTFCVAAFSMLFEGRTARAAVNIALQGRPSLHPSS